MTQALEMQLLREITEPIIATTGEGKVIYWNRGAEEVYGYTPVEAVNRTLAELIVPEDQIAEYSQTVQATLTSPEVRVEVIRARKDGSRVCVDISRRAVRGSDGGIRFILIRQSDITARKRFEQTLLEKNVELENANQVKDRFLATLSHELRTPLNAIIGFSGTLLMKLPGPLNAVQDGQLTAIQTGARHLLALINDLLDLAKIESGKVRIDLQPVRCADVIEELAAVLRPRAADKGLTVAVSIPNPDLLVMADARALGQILNNLADNAIKFTKRGTVRLDVTEDAGDPATARIHVSDTGIGIHPEDQQKLFQAFPRLNLENFRGTEGTGLGLHLSRKLAELMGGQILMESEYGTGSRFTLVLAKKLGAP
jgi:protein-histidine pros-kinase